MRCPQCNHNQKYVNGMICNSCGYQFALDPKKPPKVTDVAFRKMIDRVSGEGEYYFTYNQIVAQVYRRLKTPKTITRRGCIIYTLLLAGVAAFFNFSQISTAAMARNVTAVTILLAASSWTSCLLGYNWIRQIITTVIWIGGLAFFNISKELMIALTVLAIFAWVLFLYTVYSAPRMSAICEKIDAYHSVHPIEKMVDGKAFEYLNSDKFDEEIFQYAPDRILIVERSSIADMLLLNRFHLENKMLVVSEAKYPLRAFNACQRYLSQYPDMEVVLMHDASKKGIRMKDRLLSEPSWHLGGRHVRDLGLFPDDVARLKNPMWIPKSDGKISSGGEPAENIRKGYTMPFDVASSKAMMGAIGLAATLGLALLSEELLAQQVNESHHGFG